MPLSNLETNKLSILIEKLIPEYIRDSYPRYTTFIVKYFEYLDRVSKYSNSLVFVSKNANAWSQNDSKMPENTNSIIKGFVPWIAVGDNGSISESYDSINWVEEPKFTNKNIVKVVVNSKYFVAVTQALFDGGGNVVSPSEIWIRPNNPQETPSTVINWQKQAVPSEFSFNSIVSIEDRVKPLMYVVGDQGTIYHSIDHGVTWFRNFDNFISTSQLRTVVANKSTVLLAGSGGSGTIDGSGNLVSGSNAISFDEGTTWSPLPTGAGGVPSIQFNDSIVQEVYNTANGLYELTWILVGNSGEIYYSIDPSTAGTWTKGEIGTTANIKSIIWSNLFRKFFVCGEQGLVASSPDGKIWDFNYFPTSDTLNEIFQLDNSSIVLCSNKQPAKDLGGEFFIIKSILSLNDIDETSTVPLFLENLKKQYMDESFKSITSIDLIKFIKNIRSFYQVKGTEESYRILFRALFNIDVNLFYPKARIFKLSGSEWSIPQILLFDESSDPEWWSIISLFAGQDIATNVNTTKVSSTAFVDRIRIITNPDPAVYYSGATTLLGFEISSQNGVFNPNDLVTTFDSSLIKNDIARSIHADGRVGTYTLNTHASLKNGTMNFPLWFGTGTNSNISYTAVDNPLTGDIIRTDSLGNDVTIGTVNYDTGVVILNSDFYGFGLSTDFYSFAILIDELRPPVLHLKTELFGNGFVGNTLVGDNSGYYKNSNSRISDNSKIQDNDYYQLFSYEIQSEKSQDAWNNVILNTIHPAGFKVFSKIVFSPKIAGFTETILSSSSSTVTQYLSGLANGFNPSTLSIATSYPLTQGGGITYTASSPWNVYILNTNGLIFTGVSTATDNYTVNLVSSQSYLNYTTRGYKISLFSNVNFHKGFLEYQTILNSNRAFGDLYWDVQNANTTGIINDGGSTIVPTSNISFAKGFPFHPSSFQKIEKMSVALSPLLFTSSISYRLSLAIIGLNFVGVSTASEIFLSNYTTRGYKIEINVNQLFDSNFLRSYNGMEFVKNSNGFVQAKYNMISQFGDLPINTVTNSGASSLSQSSNITIGTSNFIQYDNGVDDLVSELFWSRNTTNNNTTDGLNIVVDTLHPSYTAWNQYISPNTLIASR